MTPNAHDAMKAGFREEFRRKLANLFLDEYQLRKDRGELLYQGRWISPGDKFEFIEEIRKEHRSLFLDLVILFALGFFGALVLVLIIRGFFFPK
jgi:hypothetical protein